MRNTKEGILAVLITFTTFVAVMSSTAVVQAQERSGEVLQQLEKKELVPRPAPEKPLIELGEDIPGKLADGKTILVKHIDLQGATLVDEPTLKAILARYENRELTLGQINRLADEITAAYQSRGYLLAYAFVPQQEIKDGRLEIRSIESKTGDIIVIGNTSYSSEFIRKHLEAVQQDPSPRKAALERALLILNDYPSLNVKARLKAGKEFGTTDITALATDSRPLSGSLSYDNFGTDTTSKHRLSATLNIGNLLASGDLLTLNGITGIDRIDFDRLSYGRAEYLFPIDHNGTKLGLSYANSIYEAGEEFTPLDIDGKAHVAGIYLTHPLIKTTDETLDIKFGFDYIDVYEYLLDDLKSEDNIRVFNLGATYDFFDVLQGRNVLTLTYHQGVRNLFGGNGRNDADTSRLDADGAFTKFTAEAVRVQKLPGYNHLMLKASGQYSDDNLFVAEQFMLGGAGSVRGFGPASQSGDSGYVLTAELYLAPLYPEARVFNQALGDTFKLVLFADHGGVHRNQIQPGEDKDDSLTALGAGIRFYYGKNFFLRADCAVPERGGSYALDKAKTYVQLTMSF